MTTQTATAVPAGRVDEVISRLASSDDVRDNRKSRDITMLAAQASSRWAGRLDILGFATTPERDLAVVCHMKATGLTWANGRAVPHKDFVLAITIPQVYPMALPAVQFLPVAPIPFNPHVAAKDFPPGDALPPELAAFWRQGNGHCCYLRASDWSPDAFTHNLATVAWAVSRIITLDRFHGEAESLNPAARDLSLQMEQRG